jgi:hypothetical protein
MDLVNVREGATLEDAWNSQPMQGLRKEFLEGKRPKACENCFSREEGGIESVRQQLNERYRNDDLDLSSVTAPASNLRQLDLSFTNDCNLTCRMCGPNCSSKWIGLAKRIPEAGARDLWHWYKADHWKPFEAGSDSLLEQMKAFPRVHEFEIKGGEPFISKEHDRFLEELSRHPNAHDYVFRYVSNGTYISPSTLKALEKFEQVTIWISVDGAGELYKYIRGGKIPIERAEDSIEKFSRLSNARVGLVFTLSVYNIFGIQDFWDWYRRMTERVPRLDIHVGMVNGPPYLSVKLLPQRIREAALAKVPHGDHPFLVSIRQALAANYESDSQAALMARFIEFTNTMDGLHGHYLIQAEPEFSNFIPELKSQPAL